MSDFGLTADGFKRKRLSDIRDSINQVLREKLGAINTEPDGLLGQLVGVASNEFSKLWQEMENVYVSQYIDTAEGKELDDLSALIGVTRLTPLATIAFVEFFATTIITVPSGTEVATTDDDIFNLNDDVLITNLNSSNVLISVNTVTNNTEYEVVIDNTAYSITSQNPATAENIISDLQSELDSNGFNATIENLNTLRILFEENGSTTLSSNLTFNEFATLNSVTSDVTGEIDAPIGSLTEIVTPVAGLIEVNNRFDSVLGRDLETDIELRARAKGSIGLQATATKEAIRNGILQNVVGVDFAEVISNRTNVEVSGRPPKSIELIVQGGDNADIAEELYNLVADGIDTFGQITETVTTGSGQSIGIRFSRPTPVYIFIDVTLTTTSAFPSAGNTLVAENLLALGQTLGLGQDVLWQSFFEAIYQVAGVTNAVLEFGESSSSGTPPASFSSSNISIDVDEISLFDITRITVA